MQTGLGLVSWLVFSKPGARLMQSSSAVLCQSTKAAGQPVLIA